MFFNFRQNNSGGFYIGPKNVLVRADTAEQANKKAVASGHVYFYGVRDGKDCECCGNRWYQCHDFDAMPVPEIQIPNLDEEHEGEIVTETEYTESFVYIP